MVRAIGLVGPPAESAAARGPLVVQTERERFRAISLSGFQRFAMILSGSPDRVADTRLYAAKHAGRNACPRRWLAGPDADYESPPMRPITSNPPARQPSDPAQGPDSDVDDFRERLLPPGNPRGCAGYCWRSHALVLCS